MSMINPYEVDHLPRAGAGLFLSVGEMHNPQPSLPDPNSHYLMGRAPSYDRSERGEVDAEVYGIWVDRGRGIVVSPAG